MRPRAQSRSSLCAAVWGRRRATAAERRQTAADRRRPPPTAAPRRSAAVGGGLCHRDTNTQIQGDSAPAGELLWGTPSTIYRIFFFFA